MLGTPAYLSPEQAIGGAIDGRSDLFALGTLLYEAITGRTPFTGSSFIEIAANVLHVEPSPPSKINPSVPRQLDFITLKALAKKASKRYQTAKEMIADLNAVKDQLDESSGQTLIRRAAPSTLAGHSRTLANLSQILQRPRIPISYILIGAAVVLAIGGLAFRFARPSVHTPTSEAQRWYDIGTAALRDGAYFQASQALERAITADDGYVLAHARYAEALVEMDYVDKAKDELLRATATDRATLPKLDLLYLDAITAAIRNDHAKSVELYKEILNQVPETDKSHVLVDLGYAYDKNQEIKKAIESYMEATNRNPQYATPFLRLGILYGRQRELASALNAFDKAEAIYQALGNLEGRTEVVYQRGTLFNQLNKLPDATTQLERALALAKAGDQTSQRIKTLLQLTSVSVDSGEMTKAAEYSREAVELAQKNGMENLSVQGLVDLGYILLVRGNFPEAEKYLLQALESASRAKARKNEARARSAMASLRDQENKPDEVIMFAEPALRFYQQGGYRAEAFSCLVLLARANLQRGDYGEAQKGHEQLLQLARDLNDQSQLARAHAERGRGLLREEKFSEALTHLDEAYKIYSSPPVPRSLGYNFLQRGMAYWLLGRYDEAQNALDQAAAIAEKHELKQLSTQVKLGAAQMMLSQGKYAEARSRADSVLTSDAKESPDVIVNAKLVSAIAHAYSGGAEKGKRLAIDALNSVKSLNEPARTAQAQLTLAETMFVAGDFAGAQEAALQAQAAFSRFGQQASEWQALVLAAQASNSLNDKMKARDYAQRAHDILIKLEQRYGAENYVNYLNRLDVQRFRKQLDQLLA